MELPKNIGSDIEVLGFVKICPKCHCENNPVYQTCQRCGAWL
jgi:ribosomal protein L40E